MADRRLPFLVAGSALAGLVVSLTGCDSSRGPTEPDPKVLLEELTEQVETAHFIFHFAPGDRVDAERQEAHHRWATSRLGLGLPRKIEYFKYRDRDHMQRLTGRLTNGWADPDGFALHAVQPANAHEAVHVYAALLGRPSDFFDEGLAVALTTNPLAGDYEPTYDGVTPVDFWARQQLRVGGLLPVADIVTTRAFRHLDEWTGYQEAGSFVHFLEQRYGLDLLAAYFARGRQDDSLGRIRDTFAAVYGFSLEEAERRWLAFLGEG